MSLKKYINIAIVAIVVNLASVFNAVFAVWSLILLIFSVFQIGVRDSNKLEKDKKVYGLIHTIMLSVIIFMSSVMGVIGILMLQYVVDTYLRDFKILFIMVSVIGIIIYYYLVIRLLREAIQVMRQKGV